MLQIYQRPNYSMGETSFLTRETSHWDHLVNHLSEVLSMTSEVLSSTSEVTSSAVPKMCSNSGFLSTTRPSRGYDQAYI
jgi:hypothetical protein